MKTFEKHSFEKRSSRKWILIPFLLVFVYFFYPHHVLLSPLQCPVPPQLNIQANRQKIADRWPQDSQKIVLVSNPRQIRPESDTDLSGYRQLSNVLYLMGTYVISDSVIVLEKCDGLCVNVFLPITDERQKVFQGVTFDLQALSTRYNATFRYMDQLPAYLGSDATIYSPSVQSLIDINLKPVIGDLSKRKLDVVYSKQLEQLFIESRFIKTQEEVEGIFYASQVAALSHSRLEKDIEKKYGESVLAKRFELYSTECGAILQAYNPIVGSGPHGAVLHYPTGESEDQGMAPLEKDEFVLVDAAGQWNGYASDLTRTYATSWTPKMRLIHSIVSLAQSKGIAAHYEGNKFSSLIEITLDTLLLGLMKAQLVIGDFESLKQSQVVKLFMPHGVGHPIGLDTHDPKPESVASDYKIAKGMVHTVEPGIYFIPFLLDLHKNNATSPWHNLVDWTKVDEYRGIGGVRIEDVVAIDPATGKNRILTRL